MNKRKFDEEEINNPQLDTPLNIIVADTSLNPTLPPENSTTSTNRLESNLTSHSSDSFNPPPNSDQLTPKKRKMNNSISPSESNHIHTFTPDSTTLDFRIINLKSASSCISEDEGIHIDPNIPEITTSIMKDDSTMFDDELDESLYLSSSFTSTEREEIREKTKKFIELQKLNEQQYVQHAVKYVRSISEVNRIINVGEWFGTEELEESFVQGISSSPSQESLKMSQVSLMSATNPNASNTPEIIFLPKVFSSLIKPHQLEGIRFCWSHIVLPTEENLKGCILGHSNGLGKTLTVIAFSYLFLKYNKGKKILIICPRSVIQNWEREISSWLHSLRLEYIPCYVLDHGKDSKSSRLEKLQEWDSKGGILLMCFTSFSRWTETQYSSTDSKNCQTRFEFEKKISQYLRGCDLAIVDEGHRLKTPSSSICKALYCNITTRNRIVLTGVPPQFDLKEYYTILDWIKPGYWSLNEFKHLFIDPINSQSIESIKQRYYVLIHELSYFVHRKDQSVLKSYLPPKREYVIQFNPHDIQVSLYNNFIQSRNPDENNIFYMTP